MRFNPVGKYIGEKVFQEKDADKQRVAIIACKKVLGKESVLTIELFDAELKGLNAELKAGKTVDELQKAHLKTSGGATTAIKSGTKE